MGRAIALQPAAAGSSDLRHRDGDDARRRGVGERHSGAACGEARSEERLGSGLTVMQRARRHATCSAPCPKMKGPETCRETDANRLTAEIDPAVAAAFF